MVQARGQVVGLGYLGDSRLGQCIFSQIEWTRLQFTNASDVPRWMKLCPDVSKRPKIDPSRQLWGNICLTYGSNFVYSSTTYIPNLGLVDTTEEHDRGLLAGGSRRQISVF